MVAGDAEAMSGVVLEPKIIAGTNDGAVMVGYVPSRQRIVVQVMQFDPYRMTYVDLTRDQAMAVMQQLQQSIQASPR